MSQQICLFILGLAVGWLAAFIVLAITHRSKRKPQARPVLLTPENRRQRSRARIRAAIEKQIEESIDPDFDPDYSTSARR